VKGCLSWAGSLAIPTTLPRFFWGYFLGTACFQLAFGWDVINDGGEKAAGFEDCEIALGVARDEINRDTERAAKITEHDAVTDKTLRFTP
jgi:hypothetical protein